jgi:hypothetical protein
MVFYSRPEMKNLSPLEPYHQKELEEVRGLLLRVLIMNGFAIAVFPFSAIALPKEMQGQLKALVGKTVAILRLCGFHAREVVD